MKDLKYFFLIVLLIFPFFPSATIIPFELIEGKIIVNVKINNDIHNFIFDSGAFTIISSDLRNQLNERKSTIVFEGIDANNSKSRMDVFSTDHLQISDLSIKNVNFSFADISWMRGRACRKISGIFGANMMKDKIWRIDFKNKIISVFDKSQERLSNTMIAIPFSEENFTSVPRVNAKIRNQNIEFVFDTGSGMGFTVNQKFYNRIKDKNFLTFDGLISQSLNSIVRGQRQVDLMDIEFNNIKLGSHIIDSSLNSLNLIGTKFLENYLVDLDFINKKIILASTGKSPEYQSFGISVGLIDDSLVIVNKLQIHQLSALKLSDKIIKINNTDVSKIGIEAFCEIKNLLENSKAITLENESHETITLEKKDILQYLNSK